MAVRATEAASRARVDSGELHFGGARFDDGERPGVGIVSGVVGGDLTGERLVGRSRGGGGE